MFCPNCNQHYDSGKFCPECGTTLVDDAPASSGAAFGIGDYAAIEGGIHMSDSHNVHNEDRSVHNITNTTSTVTNITQVSAQKTAYELQQERKTIYLTACKRAYEDNVLEQHEVVKLEELRIKLSLDKETANSILEEVRVISERNARKTVLNPIARTKLKILTENLKKNEVKALMDQIDSLEPLVRKFDYDELSRKYFLVLAALKSEKCVEMYETSLIDSYWKSFWSYLAYIKQGQLTKAEDVLISLDRFSDYPEDNMSVLAVAGALMTGNALEAKEYLNELAGEYTPALQRFVDSLYLLLEPNTAKEMGADENTCAFYLVNFFGQKDPKAKAEEERLRQEAEEQARKKAEAEAEAKRKAEEEARKKAEAKRKAEEARKKAEAERKAKEEARKKAEAERKAEEEARKKAEAKRKAEEARKKAEKNNTKCSGTTRDYEDIARALKAVVNKLNTDWEGQAREACILENGMAVLLRNDEDFYSSGIDEGNKDLQKFLRVLAEKSKIGWIKHMAFNSNNSWCIIFDTLLSDNNEWVGKVPSGLYNRLEKNTSNGEKIWSVSISENGDWAIVTDKSYSTCSSSGRQNKIRDTITKAGRLYGNQKSAYITNLGVVVCCERGVYYDNIPTNVAKKISECIEAGWIPTHVSFTDSGTYFISNYERKRTKWYM